MQYKGKRIREHRSGDTTEFLRYVAAAQPTRKDGRLPMVWLEAALSRYQGQRISCDVKSWRKGQESHSVNGIYQRVYKIGSPLGLNFALLIRDPVSGGDAWYRSRKYRRRGVSRSKRKRGTGCIYISDIVKSPDTAFWRALYKQLVAVRMTGRRKDAGN